VILFFIKGYIIGRSPGTTQIRIYYRHRRSRSRESFIAYFREMVNLISLLLRDIMILMVDGSNTSLINLDYKEKLMELVALTDIDKIFYLIRKMEFLLRDIQRNLNARVLVLEFINSYAPAVAAHG